MAEYNKKTGDMTNAQVNYGWGLSLSMTGKAPAIAKRIFETLANAKTYASDVKDSAIEGLILTVTGDTSTANNGAYFVKQTGAGCELVKLASTSASGDLSTVEQELKQLITNEETARKAQDDKIEGSVGLADDGSHIESNGTYTKGATTVVGEIAKLDAALDATDKKIAGMDYTATAADGSYIDGFTQTDGKITAHTTKSFDAELSGTSVNAPQTKVVDAAIKKATTEVKHTDVNARVKVSSSAATDGHIVYTITEDDIAQKTLLDAEIEARKAIDGQTGQTYVANTIYSEESQTGVHYIGGATSLNDADIKLDAQVKVNTDAIDTEKSTREQAITEVKGLVSTEATTARAAEKANKEAIATEKQARIDAIGTKGVASETSVFGAIKAEAERADKVEKANAAEIKVVKGDLGEKGVKGGTAFGRIEALETKVGDTNVGTQIKNAIGALDYTDTAQTGSYVSKVDQVDGIITATTKVALINSGDKVLSLKGGSINSTISLKEVTTGLGANVAKQYQLVGINGQKLGETVIDIPKDTSLNDAEFVLKKPTSETDYGKTEEEWTGGTTEGQYLKLTYTISDGGSTGGTKTKIVYVDMSALVLQTEVENGIKHQNGKLSIEIDKASEGFLTTGFNGLKLSGVQSEIDKAKAAATTTVVRNEADENTIGHLTVAEESGDSSSKKFKLTLNDVASAKDLTNKEATLNKAIQDEATTARAAEVKNANAITAETQAREAAIAIVEGLVTDEVNRAKAAEGVNANAINTETQARKDAIGTTANTSGDSTVYGAIAKERDARTKTINELVLNQVGAPGSYIQSVSQANGKLSATALPFDTVINGDGGEGNNAPTVSAVKTYVDTQLTNTKVIAQGDTYISATSDEAGRKVTVSATTALTNALGNAKTVINTEVTGESASHMTIAKKTGAASTADSYQFTLNDIASQKALKAVTGQEGSTYSKNTSAKHISGATNMNNADVLLNNAITAETQAREEAIGTKGTASETSVFGAIKEEVERATGAEDTLTTTTSGLRTELGTSGNTENGVNTAFGRIKALETKVGDTNVNTQITDAINKLDGIDSAVTNQVVTSVVQKDGQVQASEKMILRKVATDNAITYDNGLYLSDNWDCGTF